MQFNQEELELIYWCLQRLENAGDIGDERQDQIIKLLKKVKPNL